MALTRTAPDPLNRRNRFRLGILWIGGAVRVTIAALCAFAGGFYSFALDGCAGDAGCGWSVPPAYFGNMFIQTSAIVAGTWLAIRVSRRGPVWVMAIVELAGIAASVGGLILGGLIAQSSVP